LFAFGDTRNFSGAIGIAFLASVVGGVVTLSNLILGVCGGPLLGVFLLGMLTERAGPQSALVVRFAAVFLPRLFRRDALAELVFIT
jgi:hypothetical protein